MRKWLRAMFYPLQVHESQVIGQVGKGYKYAIEVLNVGRIGIGAQVGVVVSVTIIQCWMLLGYLLPA